MNGSWHRYRPGERWRRPEVRARLVLEVPGAVAVCFDAPVVELFERRAERLHPGLATLGPDLLDPEFGSDDDAEALRRLRDSARAAMTISEALLDQRAVAGIGNIWRNESLFFERSIRGRPSATVDDATLARLVATARRLLTDSARLAPGGRRCASTGGQAGHALAAGPHPVRAARRAIPRTTYWCPRCQAPKDRP